MMIDLPLPHRVRIESSSICQLKCPACPTPKGLIAKSEVGSGFLKLKDFKEIIRKNPWIAEVEISNYGELFLNPELIAILKYAHQKCVMLRASNGANLNHVTPEQCESIVKYKLLGMTCSIDGVTQETYSKYRVKGDLDTVLRNVRLINEYKQKYRSRYPWLNWQFIVFDHNRHEMKRAAEMAAELKMKMVFKRPWGLDESAVSVNDRGSDFSDTQLSDPHENHGICSQLWDWPQFNYDGKFLGCCANYWGHFGIPKGWDLKRVFYGAQVSETRRALMGLGPMPPTSPCHSCGIYKNNSSRKLWIQRPKSGGYNHAALLAAAWSVFGLRRYKNYLLHHLGLTEDQTRGKWISHFRWFRKYLEHAQAT